MIFSQESKHERGTNVQLWKKFDLPLEKLCNFVAQFQTKVGCFQITLLFLISKHRWQLSLCFLINSWSLVLHDDLDENIIFILPLHRNLNPDKAVLFWEPDRVWQKLDYYLLDALSIKFVLNLQPDTVILNDLNLLLVGKWFHYFNHFIHQIMKIVFFTVTMERVCQKILAVNQIVKSRLKKLRRAVDELHILTLITLQCSKQHYRQC
jgi:hypothetical protein